MFSILFFLLTGYLQNLVILALLFGAFNAFVKTGFTLEAFKFNSAEKKIILTVPVAYLFINVFFPGFFGTILSILAFVFIYSYFTNDLRRF